MSANKLLPFTRQVLAQSGLLLKKNVGQPARGCHVACVPPRNKVTFTEKLLIGIVLSASMWAAPFWILYHIPDYQKEERNTYTGK